MSLETAQVRNPWTKVQILIEKNKDLNKKNEKFTILG